MFDMDGREVQMCVHTNESLYMILFSQGVNGNFHLKKRKKRDLLKRDKNFSKQLERKFQNVSQKKKL